MKYNENNEMKNNENIMADNERRNEIIMKMWKYWNENNVNNNM
jgi:hypothetical protein